ncbi:hypothetical protein LLH00_04730 [bacterium]|nr:hypothetical protein [bacterium]
MKITRLLFLGIVLILFNVVYLAAAVLPDTVFVRANSAKPGDTLRVSVGIDFNSDKAGGVIAVFKIDSTLTEMLDTVPGNWWSWDTSFGKKLVDGDPNGLVSGALSALVSFDKPTGTIGVTVFGVNVKGLASAAVGVINTDQKGTLVNFKFPVSALAAEGSYSVKTAGEEGVQISKWPFADGTFSDYPVFSAPDIMIANIPEYNALQLGATLPAMIGDTIMFPVKVENKDSIGSGSFAVVFPSNLMSFANTVVAGPRGAGVNFNGAVAAVDANTSRVTVSFSGAAVPPGGLAALCQIYFSVNTASSATGTATLANVALKNMAGGALAVQAPSVASTALNYFFGDSLIVDVKSGDFSVLNVQQRKVTIPIRLVNRSKSVSVIRFYIQPDQTKPIGILTPSKINTTARTAGWVATGSVDSTNGVGTMVAYAPNVAGSVTPGSEAVFTIEYDILRPLDPSLLPMDVSMMLKGVEVLDADGMNVGIQKVDGTVSLDSRVPNNGEDVNPGSGLPKAFAMAQNSPNPFNPSTTISYQIPEDAGSGVRFTMNVYDLRGHLVKTLAQGFKAPGVYQVFWDGTSNSGQKVSSGVYLYRFSSDRYTATRKMVMLK